MESACRPCERTVEPTVRHRTQSRVDRGPSALVGAFAAEDHAYGAPEDDQVERERPVVYVVQIEPDGVVPRELGPARHLPQAGRARAYEQAAAHVPEEVTVVGGQRPGAHERHLPPE